MNIIFRLYCLKTESCLPYQGGEPHETVQACENNRKDYFPGDRHFIIINSPP
jgi:hypothetical protein